MKAHEAKAIFYMVLRVFNMDKTGDTHLQIESDFMQAVIDDKRTTRRWAYAWRYAENSFEAEVFDVTAPDVWLAKCASPSTASLIVDAVNYYYAAVDSKRKAYDEKLRKIAEVLMESNKESK